MITNYNYLNLDKPAALKASAGTGKTYSLVRIALLYLLKRENPLQLKELLLVTYTNKAAAELRLRLRELLKSLLSQPQGFDEFLQEHQIFLEKEQYNITSEADKQVIFRLLQRAYVQMDEASIYTIHGFCQYILRSYPFESYQNFHFSVFNTQDLLQETIQDFFRQYQLRIPERIHLGYKCYTYKFGVGTSDELHTLIHGNTTQKYRSHYDVSLIEALSQEISENLIFPDQNECSRIWDYYQSFLAGTSPLLATINTIQQTIEPVDEMLSLIWKHFQHINQSDYTLYTLLEFLSRISVNKSIESILENAQIANMPQPSVSASFDQWFTYLLHQLHSFDLYDWIKSDKKRTIFVRFCNTMKADFLYQVKHYVDKHHATTKQALSQLNFNDLIDNVYSVLKDTSKNQALITAIRKTLKIVLIDEFQDTDHKQWFIFQTLFAPSPADITLHSYLLIGDPKQSIYSFRGASLPTYYTAMNTISADNVCELPNNYRSHPSVIHAINRIFAPIFREGESDISSYTPVSAANKEALILCKNYVEIPGLSFLQREENPLLSSKSTIIQEAHSIVVQQCIELLHPDSPYTLKNPITQEHRAVRPSDIACLVEKNEDAYVLQSLLQKYNIPSIDTSTQSIFETSEMALILTLLKALDENYSHSKYLKRLYHSFYLQPLHDTYQHLEGKERYEKFIHIFHSIKQNTQQESLVATIDLFLQEFSITTAQLHTNHGERFFVNIRHIQEIILDIIRTTDSSHAHTIVHALLQLQKKSLANDDTNITLKLESDADAVQIMTLHKAKGLEFSIIFSYMGLNDFHQVLATKSLLIKDTQTYVKGYHFYANQEVLDTLQSINMNEAQRLFYVTLTRAQSHIYIPLLKTKQLSILQRFLFSILQISTNHRENLSGITVNESKNQNIPEDRYQYIQQQIEDLHTAHPDIAIEMIHSTAIDNLPKLLGHRDPSIIPTLHTPSLKNFSIDAHILARYSYTSLSKKTFPNQLHETSEERILFQYENKQEQEAAPTPLTILGGEPLGSLLHKLFEVKDFAITNQSLDEFVKSNSIQEQFYEYAQQYFNSHWIKKNLDIVKILFWHGLHKSLLHEPYTPLYKIPKHKQRKEFSFVMYLDHTISFSLNQQTYHLKEGFLTGFIDLIYEEDNKIYIIDWKSSALGVDPEAYDTANLETEMESHQFTLQYHIYLLALIQYAKQLDSTFSYDRIGGVYYLFLRGMTLPTKESGIYFVRPTLEEFSLFSNLFEKIVDDNQAIS
ncbi:UvrD-helicase domain-containing protein [Entomospira nematocerorum]|uniref:RecBCD enzyme subunit RecB n=1 Tax=Entomospira nematocerorum TaxID=2719987 RepID=A0A968GF64_9SPIO|nr:UvrD-helicase domain-containing protein [Entomospira nematocera]NIZ47155.1 UvrD-helicase domain-containing protein [Entomospira nematocera]WDI34302.1 UvrD-helicase domain-containing protein [Entomospira nematocera]